jgi:hypothetical protein
MQLDIIKFLKEGQLFEIREIETEDLTVKKLGKPDEIEDYGKKGKFFHYHNLRLSFFEDKLDGIAVFFRNSERTFEINVDDDVFVIGKNMPLTSMLHLLNTIGLKWTIQYEQSKLDYLLVEIQTGVKIYYNLENDHLERITKSLF